MSSILEYNMQCRCVYACVYACVLPCVCMCVHMCVCLCVGTVSLTEQ